MRHNRNPRPNKEYLCLGPHDHTPIYWWHLGFFPRFFFEKICIWKGIPFNKKNVCLFRPVTRSSRNTHIYLFGPIRKSAKFHVHKGLSFLIFSILLAKVYQTTNFQIHCLLIFTHILRLPSLQGNQQEKEGGLYLTMRSKFYIF